MLPFGNVDGLYPFVAGMKGIPTPGQAQESEGFASFPAPRGEVWILTLTALARESLTIPWSLSPCFVCQSIPRRYSPVHTGH